MESKIWKQRFVRLKEYKRKYSMAHQKNTCCRFTTAGVFLMCAQRPRFIAAVRLPAVVAAVVVEAVPAAAAMRHSVFALILPVVHR